jgi:hypothetical protein
VTQVPPAPYALGLLSIIILIQALVSFLYKLKSEWGYEISPLTPLVIYVPAGVGTALIGTGITEAYFKFTDWGITGSGDEFLPFSPGLEAYVRSGTYFLLSSILVAVLTAIYYIWQNRKRDSSESTGWSYY